MRIFQAFGFCYSVGKYCPSGFCWRLCRCLGPWANSRTAGNEQTGLLTYSNASSSILMDDLCKEPIPSKIPKKTTKDYATYVWNHSFHCLRLFWSKTGADLRFWIPKTGSFSSKTHFFEAEITVPLVWVLCKCIQQ